ncbi:hypothetical protein BJF84_21535 [Rhodococcus sp. CUA-806]|jgi:DNA-binding transcriptional LysR family regulator|nr:hypothetical protein BJF84_21535 [Rhodococcus sp. CUA-806]
MDFSQMSFRRLEIFCLVVELGGVTRAAEHLMVAQPAVSSQIKALESWLGASLFFRTGGRLVPNEAGEHAYRWAREMLSRSTAVQRDVREFESGFAGSVVVATSMGVGTYVVPPLLAGLQRSRPGAEVTVQISAPDQAISSVELGEADFAVVTWRDRALPKSVTAESFRQIPVDLYASRDGEPFSDELDPSDLAELTFVRAPENLEVERHLADRVRSLGLPDLRTAIRLGHAEAMKAAVIANQWVTFLPRYSTTQELADGRLRTVAVRGLELVEHVAIIRPTDDLMTPLQRVALDTVREGF